MHRHTHLSVELNGPKGWEIVHEETLALTVQKIEKAPAFAVYRGLLLEGWDVRLTSEEIRGMGSPVPADAAVRPNDPRAAEELRTNTALLDELKKEVGRS